MGKAIQTVTKTYKRRAVRVRPTSGKKRARKGGKRRR